MTKHDYIAAGWQRIFNFNGLRSFDDFWKHEVEWFEKPNQARGGWSGVARCELKLPEGGVTRLFLKRQENFNTRSFAHPVRGLPTFVREFRNIIRYREHGIPSLTPLYFAWRNENGNHRAVLLTEELAGFRSLEELGRDWNILPSETRWAVISAVVRLLRQIHENGLMHNCFYPKHVFLRVLAPDRIETRVIDLEKTKSRLLGFGRTFREMRRLDGNQFPWSRSERVRFFREYFGLSRLTPAAKRKWRRLARHYSAKRGISNALLAKAVPIENK